MKKLILLIFLSQSIYAEDSNLFTIDKLEGAGGDSLFYYVHLTIEIPRVELSCRLFNGEGEVVDTDKWKFYNSGWEKVVMGTGQRTYATDIKCKAKTF